MPGSIHLEVGDIFNGPSDLIVLPCSSGGGITGFVRNRLEEFNIQYPSEKIKFGSIHVFPFSGAENIASYVAFAASVKNMKSSEKSLGEIGKQLGIFASENPSVRLISSPLLGTGAGGLSPFTAFKSLTAGFFLTSPENAILKICILSEDWYNKIISERIYSYPHVDLNKQHDIEHIKERERADRDLEKVVEHPREDGQDLPSKPIRVFISYTRTSESHSEWVKNLAKFLRENGIDARLDVWHLRHGMDLTQWMCNEIDLAQKVIVICNEEYAKRADGRHGGVGWEIRIVQGDLLTRGNENISRYIPIIRSPSIPEGVPSFLKSAYGIHWSPFEKNDLARKQELLRALYQVEEEAPEIGKPPPYILTSR